MNKYGTCMFSYTQGFLSQGEEGGGREGGGGGGVGGRNPSQLLKPYFSPIFAHTVCSIQMRIFADRQTIKKK